LGFFSQNDDRLQLASMKKSMRGKCQVSQQAYFNLPKWCRYKQDRLYWNL